MSDYAELLEGNRSGASDGYSSNSDALWHVDDKKLIRAEQQTLLNIISAPVRGGVATGSAATDCASFCIVQSRHTDRWKRYYCELKGSELIVFKPSKTGGAPIEKSRSDVRFVTFNPLTTLEKEQITSSKMTTSCDMRIRCYLGDRTRVIVPSSAEEFEQWHASFQALLESRLDVEDFEKRSEAAKEVEPLFQQMVEYEQKKAKALLGALAQQGFLEYEKKNALKQGVVQMKDDHGQWKKFFFLLKPHAIAYHQSGKNHRKGFVTLKLARLEKSESSERQIKVITPMCTYRLKFKHAVAAQDWMAALQAAVRGEKKYENLEAAGVDELDAQDIPPFGKPYLLIKGGKKVKLAGKSVVIGRSSACDVTIEDKKISREHLRLIYKGPSRWIATDMGSNAGTKLNGKTMKQAYLKPGDRLKIGETTITFKAK